MIYDDKPVLRAIIEAFGAELDELNTAIIDCKNKRWIETGEGAQLDGIGEIVVRPRQIDKAIAMQVFGFYGQPNVKGFGQARFRGRNEQTLSSYFLEDAEYRMILAVKARMNATQCTAEDTIASLKYVFNAPIVFEEVGNANIVIAIGKTLTDNEKLLANAVNLIVRAGGVGIQYKAYYNPSNYFGFLGQPGARGFGVGEFAHSF